ncbi:aromatic amino acid DMT transporter YddG [Bifidobacterium platyrrhinorum]|uniref:Aromatic amino acid DMT transporter YddG n=1 Tax=Bifidobacterium platyrrhinorum TaxID=2661628 RepID=A0A6L9SS68_9BIFI|nr:aromatic amino acid DMT transporter YddG [Bifidobacterium platyrrhinorum]NEG54633.1 aromatic amino acid DMT transporter YddG [Bifidobacterium platyrrhinorum]
MDADEKRRGYVPATWATAVGLLAIVLWSLMTALVRVVSESFGATLGSALIYTCGAVLLFVFHRPEPIAKYPRRYLAAGGALFVFYESSISLSIGLASTAEQSVEVSLVNYLWPTMMVLLAAAMGRPRRKGAVLRALPGALVATVGVALAVGGNGGLRVDAAVAHIAANPLPYLLALAGAFAWSFYAVITPAMSGGLDGTSVFFPGVAAVLWIIHAASGEGMPHAAPGPVAWLAVLACAAVIAGGYACWGYGILHGSLRTLAVASYATPVLSVAASAVVLGLSLSLPFWCGVLFVVAGSLLNWLAERLAAWTVSNPR